MPRIQPHAFLSYAREDVQLARAVYEHLTAAGINAWFDQESLRPGERWREAIQSAIRDANYFIALISSRSSAKREFVQTEIRRALEVLEQLPDDDVYLIPVRIEECRPPIARLDDLNWLDLFPDRRKGLEKLVQFLRVPETDLTATAGIGTLVGIYQSQRVSHQEGAYWHYLRFFADGLVIAVSSTGNPKEVARWFNRNNSEISRGAYRLVGGAIKFAATSSEGTVEYDGEVSQHNLILRSHSYINGHRGVAEYRHVSPDEI